MDKLKMQTANKADENFKKLAAMFPNAVTETIDENGEVVRAIDKDVLMQEISCKVVDGNEERYQFTWPDKKKSVLLANTPINKTLRPCREESVDFDNTENLYIEGDNLEVLKLLQETYLGKIKMIYIDPPYNTGNDFVYNDEFGIRNDEWDGVSGNYDDEGNLLVDRLVKNTESNGRFHTDWLNMIYPRLKIAKDLLTDDGVIFISIDENEIDNLKKACIEIFGKSNYIATLVRKTKTTSNNGNQFAPSHEYIVVCAKDITLLNGFNDSEAQEAEEYVKLFKYEDDYSKYNVIGLYQPALKHGGSSYPIECPDGSFVVTPDNKPWRWNEQTFLKNKSENRVVFKETKTSPLLTPEGKQAKWNIYTKLYLKERLESGMRPITFIDKYTNSEASKELIQMDIPFDFSKPRRLIQYLMKICIADKDSLILDFFSGSATTAHAVMQLNAEDGGHRKFIMVQLPEETEEKSEAYKAGFKNICEIGKERIRRAGNKILEEATQETVDIAKYGESYEVDETMNKYKNLDVGFRVLKCDSSNMKDVYYSPNDYDFNTIDDYVSNIKEDRTPEDLLFQVMLDLGVLLSSKIDESTIDGKKVFNVADNFLIACFDNDVTEATITEIAKKKPYYFVMRDSSMANDSVATNFDQIFATYSPETTRKVL
ncbi:MAG: site-specific DNA-methyltransferase [Eubacteriales bacterium]|nr:site-specific DNA-methyltransferase [Eubacteriales bacterium]